MTNIIESNTWEAGIYQLETTDPVQGGADGIDNLQAKQLGNRTTFLKYVQDRIIAGLQTIKGNLLATSEVAGDPVPQDNTSLVANTRFAQRVAAFYATRRNPIINGDFGIDQRNEGAVVTLTSGSGPQFIIDRWEAEKPAGSRTITVKQDKDVHRQDLPESPACLLIDLTSGMGTVVIRQRIPGMFLFSDVRANLSFYFKTNRDVTLSVTVRVYARGIDIGNNPLYEESHDIACQTGTSRYSQNIAMPFNGTVESSEFDEQNCVEIEFSISDTNHNTVWLTDVQFERGELATRYERKPQDEELQTCLQFYEKIAISEKIVTNGTSGIVSSWFFRRNFEHKRILPVITHGTMTYNAWQGYTPGDITQNSFLQELKAPTTNPDMIVTHTCTGIVEINAEIE